MRIVKYFTLFIISFILTVNCSSDKKNKSAQLLADNISDQLLDWKLSNNTVVKENDKTLEINIFYKQTDDSSFFFDVESNNMVIAMLGYTFYDELKIYEIIEFQLKFEGFPDILKISMDQSKLQSNINNFNSSPNFYSFVEYSFIHLEYMGVLRLTQLTNHLNNIINEIFDFEGSFWDLLFLYSNECEKVEKNRHNIYHFVMVISEAIELDEYEGHRFSHDTFNYYLNSCGYNEALLKNPFVIIE